MNKSPNPIQKLDNLNNKQRINYYTRLVEVMSDRQLCEEYGKSYHNPNIPQMKERVYNELLKNKYK